ncbi:hypothetical protein D3C72_2400540 [compost metagenome]
MMIAKLAFGQCEADFPAFACLKLDPDEVFKLLHGPDNFARHVANIQLNRLDSGHSALIRNGDADFKRAIRRHRIFHKL